MAKRGRRAVIKPIAKVLGALFITAGLGLALFVMFDGIPSDPIQAPAPSSPIKQEPLECSAVFADGVFLLDRTLDEGCMDHGIRKTPTVTLCKDGRRLARMGGIVGITGSMAAYDDYIMYHSRLSALTTYRLECA